MKDTIKNILLVTTFIFCFSHIGKSQVTFGAGLTYLNEIGVQARSEIQLDRFNLIPKASYYIVDDVTSWSIEVDASYDLLTFGDDNPVYLFSGPALYKLGSNTDFGITIGAGMEISQIYGEIKYTTLFCTDCNGQIGFAAGYMF